jgi:hypothetical protein
VSVTTGASGQSGRVSPDTPDFSLVLGGPLFQFFLRAHLSDDGLMLARRRVVFFALICWLPLCVLTAIDGQWLNGTVAVPFLKDVDTHLRFLVAVPLLVVAELVVHVRMRPVTKLFLDRNLIPDSARSRFDAAISSAFRLRNSMLAETLLLATVYGVGVLFVWPQYVALHTATWYATPSADGSRWSMAGLWYVCLSLPICQFLLLRWYFRLFIWARLLWQVSRIELRLIPTHPDRSGGLGFLTLAIYAFVPILAAHGVLAAGHLANRILYVGANLLDFKIEVVVLVAVLLCVFAGPFLVFAPQLARVKRTGAREYGTMAERYVREFDSKWLRGGAAADEALLGTSDIQSLADLANSLEVVRTMRPWLITKEVIIVLVAAVVAPLAPLLLTIMPLSELLKKVAGIVF